MRAEQNRRLLEEPIPALEGRTPRQAAGEPSQRGRLLQWAKTFVQHHDRRNLMTGRMDDINGWIRELGLNELDVPPPPPRPIPEDLEDDSDADEWDEGDDPELEDDFAGATEAVERLSDWSAPPLPERPLAKETEERVRHVMDAFGSAAAMFAELEDTNATVLDGVWRLCAEEIDQDQFGVVALFVAQSWFALVPRGRVPVLRFAEMAAEFERQLDAMPVVNVSPERTFNQLLASSPQPRVLEAVAAQLLQSAESGPRELRLKPPQMMLGLVALKVLIGELDHALRE